MLLNQINNILDSSKMKFMTLKVSRQNVDLRELCSIVLKLFEFKVKHKKIKLICNIDEQIPKYIVSDKNRVRQILLNLVGNSIKFTNRGFVKVLINREGVAGNQGKWIPKISVIDTGIGIKEKDKKKLFRPFGMLDSEE